MNSRCRDFELSKVQTLKTSLLFSTLKHRSSFQSIVHHRVVYPSNLIKQIEAVFNNKILWILENFYQLYIPSETFFAQLIDRPFLFSFRLWVNDQMPSDAMIEQRILLNRHEKVIV